MDAIVYTSNTGFTERYARLLGEASGLPVLRLGEGTDGRKKRVIYLGWMMAGKVMGYPEAAKQYSIQAVCPVGMGGPGSQSDESIMKQNRMPVGEPVFYLQGGFDLSKLHGKYRFMMKLMIATVGRKLARKKDRTAEEDDMLELLTRGGSRVKAENLAPVLAWMSEQA